MANYIQQYKNKNRCGVQANISHGALEQWCIANAIVPDDTDKPFVVDYRFCDDDEFIDDNHFDDEEDSAPYFRILLNSHIFFT